MGQTVSNDADRRKLQGENDNLEVWASAWGMAFNVAKCKIMHLGHDNSCFENTMNVQKLGTTDMEKDIGLMVSKSL